MQVALNKELKENLELINELENKRIKLLNKLFITGGSFSLVFLFGVFKLVENPTIISRVTPLLFLFFIYIFIILSLKFGIKNSFIKELNETIFKAIGIKDIKFSRDSRKLKKVVLNFSKSNSGFLITNDEFSGILSDVKFKICDGELWFGTVKFKGKIFNARLKKEFDSKVLITNLGIISAKNLEEIKLDSVKFSQNFKVFSSDLTKAFYILNPVFIERLESLVGDKKADILLYKDEILIILDNKIDSLEPNLFKKITSLNTQEFTDQIQSFEKLIKFLRLS